ncbi:MAG TPA: ATPase, T2SS/T4P/T4SS family [Allosphingosinicella sp.]|nr:ATPase, T2SS/T4P/T4SS family [Allosphingosinicella sp.]
MRLDAHATRRSDRAAHSDQDGRGPVGLPPFFAGMTRAARTALEEALDEAGGLILVAGPRNSGRATTLRCLLRARPDALAIGDIGGPEPAAAAFRAARGRLVLATIEAGDSIAALDRIVGFGIQPFSIACVLRLALAQRLAHRLCPSCRTATQPPNSVTAPLGLEPGAVVCRANGCGRCDGKGYAGPIGVFEALPVDSNVGRLIVCGAEQAAIANHVFRTWPNLAAAVRALVIQGHASAEEAIELIRPQHAEA